MMKLSLKTRVTTTTAGLMAVAFLSFGLAVYLPLRNALLKQEHGLAQALGSSASKRWQATMAELDAAMLVWSGSDFLRTAAADRDAVVSRYLRDQQGANRHLVSRLFVLDAGGTVLAASDRSLAGRRLPDAWRGEVAERLALTSEAAPTVLPFTEHAGMAVSRGLELSGGQAATLVAYLNWNALLDQVLLTPHADGDQDETLLFLHNARGAVMGVSSHAMQERLAGLGHAPEHLTDLGASPDAAGADAGFSFEGHHFLMARQDAMASLLGHEVGWSVAVARDDAIAEGPLASVRLAMLSVGLGMLALVVGCVYLLASRAGRSLLQLVPAFEKLAGGDLETQVSIDTGGEVGILANHFNNFVVKLRGAISNVVESTRMLTESSHLLADLSSNLVGNAQETSSQAGAASKISDEVSTNINTVSAGVEEMSLSINEIARSSDEAARVATSAVRIAEMTNTTVAELGGSSSEIGNVIKVINSIAEQTNLLALNATIEAARAGEAGKGFAVVANEVKELAKETARATEDIGKKIEAIQAKTKGAVTAIGEIGSIINQVNDYQTTIASAVQEQLATTTEIGRNIAEVAERSYMITKNISTVAQIAQNASTGANDTRQATNDISRISQELHGIVDGFRYAR